MPTWTKRPTPQQRTNHIPLLRTPHKGKHQAICLSEDLTGTDTHFFRNRTTPCTAPKCPACDHDYPARWHAWIAAWAQRRDQVFLFEMTAALAEPFAAYHDHYGTLRGAQFVAYRPSGTPNGRIALEIRPADLAGIHLPPCPDVVAQLSIIWSIPRTDMQRETLPGGNGELKATLRDLLRVHNPTLGTQTRQNKP